MKRAHIGKDRKEMRKRKRNSKDLHEVVLQYEAEFPVHMKVNPGTWARFH